MQSFVAIIEERVLRKVKLVGRDVTEARANLGALPPGARLVSVNAASWTLAASGAEALAYIRARDYLDWQGQTQTVEDWLLRALDPANRGAVNDKLAFIGLRVLNTGRVAVANRPPPQLARWLQGTEWEWTLPEALAAMPGAKRGLGARYFNGFQTRCAELPFDAVVPPVAEAAE